VPFQQTASLHVSGALGDRRHRLRYWLLSRFCYEEDLRHASESSLRGLKNLSWLKASQLSKLAKALRQAGCANAVLSSTKEALLIPHTAYILLSGVVRITYLNRNGHRAVG